MSQDHYETLQVHQRADGEAIRAAYERLRVLYDPARLEGAADELIAVARRRLVQIENAYAVLSDPALREDYDRAQSAPTDEQRAAPADAVAEGEALLDYRPLPPAGRKERIRGFSAEPVLSRPTRSHPNLQVAVALGVALVAVVVGMSVLLTNWSALSAPERATAPAANPTASVLDQYEIAIAEAKRATEQSPNDPQVWIIYGNQLYDSAQIVRENMPDSTLYQQRIPRWFEASQAYARALELAPDNAAVLADKGTSLCYYGVGVGDQTFVSQGIEDVKIAAAARPDDPLIQLNLGNCLVSALPPQVDAAMAAWQRVLQIAPADSPLAERARELITQYQPQP